MGGTVMRRLALALLLAALATVAFCPSAQAFVSTGYGGWVWQTPEPQGNGLTALAAPDAAHVWAVGWWGTILASTNGGVTWAGQHSGTQQPLTAVSFVDASRGWAVGWGGTIVSTSDGGAHWRARTSGTVKNLRAVDFANASRGWTVG